jgi:hypothetical protein
VILVLRVLLVQIAQFPALSGLKVILAIQVHKVLRVIQEPHLLFPALSGLRVLKDRKVLKVIPV